MPAFRRKYATATHIYIPLIKRGVVDFALGADWTPAAGDVKVSIDGGAAANIGTLPSAIAMGNAAMWDFTIATGEVTGKKIVIIISDSATKAVEDDCIEIETYGNASAEYQPDISAANTPQSGDAYARIGANGAGLTSLGDTRLNNLDATVSSRLASASYTAPPSAATISTQVASDLQSAHGSGSWTTAIGFATVNPDNSGIASAAASASSAASSAASAASAASSAASSSSSILGKLAGITLLAKWLGALMGKTADTATRAEINATTAGAGYNETTDSLEAVRDHGDVAWVTGGGGGGGSTTIYVTPVQVTVPERRIISSGAVQSFRYCPLPSGPYSVFDDALSPIDLSAYAVKMMCIDEDGLQAPFTLVEGVELSVGGTNHNQVTVTYIPLIFGSFKWHLFIKPDAGGDWDKKGEGVFEICDGPNPQ